MVRTASNPRRELQEACRRRGLPFTPQRALVLETLAARDDHPTADQLLDAVRGPLPGISRTTVYRVLDALVRLGLAVKTCTPGSAVRFDARTERHHHLVCLACEKVIDLYEPALDALDLSRAKRTGFEIRDYSVHFRGTCPDCRARQARGKAARRKGGSS